MYPLARYWYGGTSCGCWNSVVGHQHANRVLECQWVANIEKLCAMVWAAVVGGVPKRAARRYCVLPRGENDA